MTKEELAKHLSEKSIRFNIDEWEQEYDELEIDIFNKQEKLKYIQEKIDIWKKALKIKKEENKMIKKKRINWSKLTRAEAQKMIDESRGMPKAKWERLWDIAHRKRK